MVKIKLEKNKKSEPVFKLNIKDKEIENYRFLKRALMEGKTIKGGYNYEIPIRFFEPIFKNLKIEEMKFNKKSITQYFEFSDEYDEKYFYRTEINAGYMKKWREEGCPDIYKILIDKETCTLTKELAFKKIERNFSILDIE